MNKSKLLQVVVVGICLVFLGGCVRPSAEYYPDPEDKITVNGDKLYHDNQVYAELRYWGTIEQDQSHSGLAIYYYSNAKEEWIFPKIGLGYYIIEENKLYSTIAEMKELEKSAAEKGLRITDPRTGCEIFDREKMYILAGNLKWEPYEKAAPFSRVFDIHFTRDGKYVCYQVEGAWPNSRKYRVKYEDCFVKNR